MANIGTAQSAVSLTGAGTTQATALEVVAEHNYFSTVASGTGAILWDEIGEGQAQTVYNAGANDLRVYPHLTAQINNLGTNQAMLLPTNTACKFTRVAPTQWTGILSR